MKKGKLSALLVSLLVMTSATSTAFAMDNTKQNNLLDNKMPVTVNPIVTLDQLVKADQEQNVVNGEVNPEQKATEVAPATDTTPATDVNAKPETSNGEQASDVVQAPTQGEGSAVTNPAEEVTVPAKPVEETPVVEAPVVTEPTVEAPVIEAPKTEPTTTEKPVTEAPVVEAPAVEAPVVTAPAVDVPVVEVPVVTEPAIEVPVVTEAAVEVPVMTTLTIKHILYLDQGQIEGQEVIANLAMGTEFDLTSRMKESGGIICLTKTNSVLINEENKMVTIEYKTVYSQGLVEQNIVNEESL